MMKPLGTVLGAVLTAAALAAPIGLAVGERVQTPNFHIVRDGVLYRCAQPTLFGLQRTVHDLGIRTVVNLREGIQPADRREEQYCKNEEITFVRIPPLSWEGVRGSAPVDQGIDRFLEVMRDPKNYPVLIHCFAGIHRTGAYCAVYRMEMEGWSNERAIAELKSFGYVNFDVEDDIRGYLSTYRPCCDPPRHSRAPGLHRWLTCFTPSR